MYLKGKYFITLNRGKSIGAMDLIDYNHSYKRFTFETYIGDKLVTKTIYTDDIDYLERWDGFRIYFT